MTKVRSFIAVPIPEAVKQQIVQLQTTLRANLPEGITWVKPDAMHITLKFLGEIESTQIAKIKQLLPQILNEHSAFRIEVAKLGAFPHNHAPRVVWVGLQEASDRLAKMQQRLETALAAIGIPPEEKEASLHITLARVKHKLDKLLPQLLKQYADIAFGTVPVDRVVLFQSELRPSGPVYTPLAEIKLSVQV